jgi:hypothetical protein
MNWPRRLARKQREISGNPLRPAASNAISPHARARSTRLLASTSPCPAGCFAVPEAALRTGTERIAAQREFSTRLASFDPVLQAQKDRTTAPLRRCRTAPATLRCRRIPWHP